MVCQARCGMRRVFHQRRRRRDAAIDAVARDGYTAPGKASLASLWSQSLDERLLATLSLAAEPPGTKFGGKDGHGRPAGQANVSDEPQHRCSNARGVRFRVKSRVSGIYLADNGRDNHGSSSLASCSGRNYLMYERQIPERMHCQHPFRACLVGPVSSSRQYGCLGRTSYSSYRSCCCMHAGFNLCALFSVLLASTCLCNS